MNEIKIEIKKNNSHVNKELTKLNNNLITEVASVKKILTDFIENFTAG